MKHYIERKKYMSAKSFLSVTAPIVGPGTEEELDSVLRAIEIKLLDDVMKKLDEIWPGPGGEAPVNYAW